jgi:hypothetical protein
MRMPDPILDDTTRHDTTYAAPSACLPAAPGSWDKPVRSSVSGTASLFLLLWRCRVPGSVREARLAGVLPGQRVGGIIRSRLLCPTFRGSCDGRQTQAELLVSLTLTAIGWNESALICPGEYVIISR